MWSLGVLIYCMLSGYFPFNGRTKKDIVKSIYSGVYTFKHQGFMYCTDEVKDLISKLLYKDPKYRISAD